MKHPSIKTAFLFLASIGAGSLAFAQPAAPQESSSAGIVTRLSATGSFTSSGDAETNGVENGELKTKRYRVSGSVEFNLSEEWKMELGALFDRIDIDTDTTGIPLSERLDATAATIAATWRINRTWSARLELRPGLYGDSEVDSSDAFTVPAAAVAQWRFRPNLGFTFGASVHPFADSPVSPILGVQWKIDDKWSLTAGYPRTELAYAFDARTSFFIGFSGQRGSYAVDDPSVLAPEGKNLGDTKIEVREYRALVGARRELGGGVYVRIEGGYAFGRKFDYYDRGVEVKADSALFGALSLGVSF